MRRSSVVRRLFFTRIADLRRISQRDHASLQPRDLLAIPAQLRMQAEQCLVHLFEIMLRVCQRRFEANQSVFSGVSSHDGGAFEGSVACDVRGHVIE